MTKETENLILEHLRVIRGDIAAVDRKVEQLRSDMNGRFAMLSQRLDRMQSRIDASQSIMTSTPSSILVDHADLKERVTAVETAGT